MTLPPQSWVEAEPGRLDIEQAAMAALAPGMTYRDDLSHRGRNVVGWEGEVPAWGADRVPPAGLDELLTGRRLRLAVFYPQAYPMAPPELDPIEPEVPIHVRGFTQWHVNPDGTLCTVQRADDWDPVGDTAADLVRKSSGWFVEYLLLDGGHIERMTESGIFSDTSLDPLIESFA